MGTEAQPARGVFAAPIETPAMPTKPEASKKGEKRSSWDVMNDFIGKK